ncbi:MAG TPA: EscU/YscU/HrcU family type III secretion system export apparatus switch protein, partial [Bryobacteraceae bacterium]|nr:EscU/YscU/HrcU family type III secretion system export apparatus switch protein [Bryobacteraceae bacterium]
MADSQHTEKPTQRRVDRARREGNFPASREFISSVHFLGFVALAVLFAGEFILRIARVMRELLARAFSTEITQTELVSMSREFLIPLF